jgi:hypothetical protein
MSRHVASLLTLMLLFVVSALSHAAPLVLNDLTGKRLLRVGDLPDFKPEFGVPADYVVTPFGLFDASCVVDVRDNEALLADGSLITELGNRRKPAACKKPHFDRLGDEAIGPDSVGARTLTQPAATSPGYYAKSFAFGQATRRFSGSYNVPPKPSLVSNQLIYLFPGLEGQPVNSILQPVLTFTGGNNNWTVTNWFCCVEGNTHTGNTIQVTHGDRINWSMYADPSTCNSSTGVCTKWTSTATNTSTNTTATLTFSDNTERLSLIFGGALEAFGVTTCEQFPSNGLFTVYGSVVSNLSGTPYVPAWQSNGSTLPPSCQPQAISSYDASSQTSSTVVSFRPTTAIVSTPPVPTFVGVSRVPVPFTPFDQWIMSWSPTRTATSYKVLRRVNGSSNPYVVITTTSETNFSFIDSLTGQYQFVLQSCNASGCSANSASVTR